MTTDSRLNERGRRSAAEVLRFEAAQPKSSAQSDKKTPPRKETLRESVARLTQELQDALEVARRRDAFIATLSHELRTPLSPVLLLASAMAADLSLPASTREAFDIVRKNIELETRLIDELLDLNLIHHGKLQLKKSMVDIAMLIREVLAILNEDLKSKKLKLKLNLTAEHHHVWGDAVRLQQILWNLMRNAIKFTPANGQIAVETLHARPNTLAVVVRDSGIGMTASELQRAFEPFAQGDHVRSGAKHGGLGLGLAISRRLAAAHHGRIQATSPGRGKGSAFVFEIKIAAASRQVSSQGRRETLKDSNQLRQLRILIVEDHDSTREALCSLLRRRGHEVFFATAGAQAIGQISVFSFDVVICDVGLPDISGYELIQDILAIQPTIRAIALTGRGTTGEKAQSLKAGFTTHLTKPIDFSKLETALYPPAKPAYQGVSLAELG